MKIKVVMNVLIMMAGLNSCIHNNNGEKLIAPGDSINDKTIDKISVIEPPTFINRPDNTVVDLTTGRKAKVRIDSVSRDIVDEVTGKPLQFFVDPSNNDTFDTKGNKVNNALIKGRNNSWMIDKNKRN